MNKGTYLDQIGRLQEQFGVKSYGDERVNAIWEWAKNTHEKIFVLAITEAIANCAQVPLKGKLIEIYMQLRMKFPEIKNSTPCVFCGSGGMVCDDEHPPTAYRCRCPNGARLSPSIKEWVGELIKKHPSESELLVMEKARVERLIKHTMNKKIEGVEI